MPFWVRITRAKIKDYRGPDMKEIQQGKCREYIQLENILVFI